MSEPIFQPIFGQSWNTLPVVMQKHYANRPYTDDVSVVKGTLNVMCKAPLKWIAPVMKLMGQIPAYSENNVPVTVEFRSDPHTNAFHFVRRFDFKGGPYVFHSRMVHVKDDEVIEIMRFGLGWRMGYSWNGEKVELSHRGYVLHLFGRFIPLPLGWIMGESYAEERAIDDHTFEMSTNISHPWWGKVYEYKGTFEVVR
ncbi:DUF4166 domain-containing protein [Hahella ganghwensis]|uniref:DUF4166 domain-containing protein n=1 Tax=Hahella ganghwensis TaxID=286420 RepID=UPI0003745688|nr:DUF4166 domain-containing protein [Hahella ganghwensis]